MCPNTAILITFIVSFSVKKFVSVLFADISKTSFIQSTVIRARHHANYLLLFFFYKETIINVLARILYFLNIFLYAKKNYFSFTWSSFHDHSRIYITILFNKFSKMQSCLTEENIFGVYSSMKCLKFGKFYYIFHSQTLQVRYNKVSQRCESGNSNIEQYVVQFNGNENVLN